MDLFNRLFSDDIKEAQDIQGGIEQNEALQEHVRTKINILRRAQNEPISAIEFDYFQKEENRTKNELKRLIEDHKKLQEKFRISTNRVSVLQNATKNYEKDI